MGGDVGKEMEVSLLTGLMFVVINSLHRVFNCILLLSIHKLLKVKNLSHNIKLTNPVVVSLHQLE